MKQPPYMPTTLTHLLALLRSRVDFELLLSILFTLVMMTVALPRLFARTHGSSSTELGVELHALRKAIGHFKADTGVYPAVLQDIVAPNASVLITTVKSGTYNGPYLPPNGGIGGTGIPPNPFSPITDTATDHHWKYTPTTGSVTVPDFQAGMKTEDGVRFSRL